MSAGPNSALDASVLVLNKVFMAVHVVSVRRAFCLLCKELAEVVAHEDGQFATYDFATWRELSEYRRANFRPEEDDWVRTATTEIQVPRVIRLLDYDKVPKQTVKFNRRNIFAREQVVNLRGCAGDRDRDLCGRGQVVLHDERVVVVAEQRDLRRAAVQANRFGRPQSRADHRKHGRRQRVQIGRIVGNGQDIELALGIIAR